MNSPREFYKKKYPNYFSDTTTIQSHTLDKSFFEYHLDTLTSRNQQNDFERFCHKLAEMEICPNLKPQTGPTGGGDSKVDAETYPVTQQVAATWYLGLNNDCPDERWAFAFSAKKEWKSKVESDVKKIAETTVKDGRSYKKVFFITNQFVSDKKGADVQDRLSKAYGFEVTILDRQWIVSKVFDHKRFDIAVSCLGLSTNFLENKVVGPKDYEREKKLEEAENALSNPAQDANIHYAISNAQKAAFLSREMEKPLYETNGRFERLFKLVSQSGTDHQIVDCLYEWARTLFWWYEDNSSFMDIYRKFEDHIKDTDNPHFIILSTNLWYHLCSFGMDNNDEKTQAIKTHADTLLKLYNNILDDKGKPNAAIELKGYYLCLCSMLHEKSEDVIDSFIKLFDESKENLNFDFRIITKLIIESGQYNSYPKYDLLFEKITNLMGERQQELAVSRLYVQRGIELSKEKPYSAIKYLGKAIGGLYKAESKWELIVTLIYLSDVYEEIGCYWAARNYSLHAFYLASIQYIRYGEVHLAIAKAADGLKRLSLRLGHLLYAIRFYELESRSYGLIKAENADYSMEEYAEESNKEFDALLAVALTKTPFDHISEMSPLPHILSGLGLYTAEIVAKHMLGHYDADYLGMKGHTKDSLDDFASAIHSQPASEQILYTPWYCQQKMVTFQTVILGSKIIATTPNHPQSIELAASVLSATESFFSTGMLRKIILASDVRIKILMLPQTDFSITVNPEHEFQLITVKYSPFDNDSFAAANKSIPDALYECLTHSIALLIAGTPSLKSVHDMIVEEDALNRSIPYLNSVNIWESTFGDSLLYSEDEIKESIPQLRSTQFEYAATKTPLTAEGTSPRKIIYGRPDDFDLEAVSQSEIYRSELIDISLWDKSVWVGVAYLRPVINEPPTLGLIFQNKLVANQIFTQWKDKWDVFNNEMLIGIIKGISERNPYHYRVIITPAPYSNKSNNKLYYSLSRLHTMQVNDHVNLDNFVSALKGHDAFYLCPVFINPNGGISVNNRKMLMLNKSCFQVHNIWDIPESSLLLHGIMPSDKPIIKENNHVYSYLKIKSGRVGRNDPCPCGSGKKFKKCCGHGI